MIKTKVNVRIEYRQRGWLLTACFLVGALGLGPSGCAVQRTASSPTVAVPVEIQDSYSVHHPVMVLYSDEMLALLAEGDQGDGGNNTDWITHRNDRAVGLGRVVWDPYAYSKVIITDDDSLRDTHGRPYNSSRRRVRTIRSGRGR